MPWNPKCLLVSGLQALPAETETRVSSQGSQAWPAEVLASLTWKWQAKVSISGIKDCYRLWVQLSSEDLPGTEMLLWLSPGCAFRCIPDLWAAGADSKYFYLTYRLSEHWPPPAPWFPRGENWRLQPRWKLWCTLVVKHQGRTPVPADFWAFKQELKRVTASTSPVVLGRGCSSDLWTPRRLSKLNFLQDIHLYYSTIIPDGIHSVVHNCRYYLKNGLWFFLSIVLQFARLTVCLSPCRAQIIPLIWGGLCVT